MAKLSVISRNEKRERRAKRVRAFRSTLKKLVRNGTPEEQEAAVLKLQKRSPNESMVRVRQRCRAPKCGRHSGTYQKFGLCRIHLREAAVRGDIPGLTIASW